MTYSTVAAEVGVCSADDRGLSTLRGLVQGRGGLTDRVAVQDGIQAFLFLGGVHHCRVLRRGLELGR